MAEIVFANNAECKTDAMQTKLCTFSRVPNALPIFPDLFSHAVCKGDMRLCGQAEAREDRLPPPFA
jgi:hypothetical protein